MVPTGASGRPLAGVAVVVVPTGASGRPLAGVAVVVVPTGASGRASIVGLVLALAEAACALAIPSTPAAMPTPRRRASSHLAQATEHDVHAEGTGRGPAGPAAQVNVGGGARTDRSSGGPGSRKVLAHRGPGPSTGVGPMCSGLCWLTRLGFDSIARASSVRPGRQHFDDPGAATDVTVEALSLAEPVRVGQQGQDIVRRVDTDERGEASRRRPVVSAEARPHRDEGREGARSAGPLQGRGRRRPGRRCACGRRGPVLR